MEGQEEVIGLVHISTTAGEVRGGAREVTSNIRWGRAAGLAQGATPLQASWQDGSAAAGRTAVRPSRQVAGCGLLAANAAGNRRNEAG